MLAVRLADADIIRRLAPGLYFAPSPVFSPPEEERVRVSGRKPQAEAKVGLVK